MKKLFLFIFLLIGNNLESQIFHVGFDESDGVSSFKDIISNTTFDIKNNFGRPERISGVVGNALRFDGWSTWAVNNFPISSFPKTNKFSIECWFATEAFTAQRSAIISQENNSNGFGLEIGPTGTIYAFFYLNGKKNEIYSLIPISKYEWNLIGVTADGDSGELNIYLNGKNVGIKKITPSFNNINFAKENLYIGRSTSLKYFDLFPLNVINGALDELKLFDSVKSENYFVKQYETFSKFKPDLKINSEKRFEGDFLRPKFHAIPDAVWTNEPYGLIYFNKKYHLFFQKNPNGPYLYFMHWGHLTSTDLVTWQEEKIALAPGANLESFGIWSGSVIVDKSGMPNLFYTGVNGNWASINKALPKDSSLIEWKKYDSNPLIDRAPSNFPNMDFRDPFIFEANGYYYMIIGSGKSLNNGGMLISYKSKDLNNWTLMNPIFEQRDAGIFWEMPSIIKFDDSNFMLTVTPIPTESSAAKSVYWLGNFKDEKFIPNFNKPLNFELINGNLLSPAFGEDKNKNPIYLGIIPEERDVIAQIKAGWRNVFSLPRMVRLLKDSTVGQIPHPNLCSLRTSLVHLKKGVISEGSSNNLGVSGTRLELDLNLRADSNSVFSIVLFKNPNFSEQTSLIFDLQQNTIELDRTNSSVLYPIKNKLIGEYIMNHKEDLNIHIFLDGSIIEVFVDQIVVFSCRVYPSSSESNLVDLLPIKGNITLLNSNAWELSSKKEFQNYNFCSSDTLSLPSQLRKKTNESLILGIKENIEDLFTIFPNPTSGMLFLKSSFSGDFKLKCYNSLGVEINCSSLRYFGYLNLSDFQPGIYFFLIQTENWNKVFKIIYK